MSPGKRGRPVQDDDDNQKPARPTSKSKIPSRTRPDRPTRSEPKSEVTTEAKPRARAAAKTVVTEPVAVEPTPQPKPDKAPKAAPSVSGWRQTLYKIPVIGTIAYIIWPAKRSSSWIRRSVSSTLAVIAILGIGMAAYPWAGEKYPGFYRIPVEKLIEWSNFLSDLQTNKLQDQLAKEFAGLKTVAIKDGDPLTRFQIPKLGVDTIVVQGTSPSALRAGAGHYPSTPLPGAKGNVAIAGHRTTYGRPFNSVEKLKVGDKIILTTPIGQYTYAVSRPPFITHPFDWTIVAKSKDPLLTLTTCHPKGSARQRLVIRAKLVKTVPVEVKKAA